MKPDRKIAELAEEILRRPLSGEEELEIYRIADAVGMRDVQSFLYLLLVFKLHDDTLLKLEGRLNERFGEMGALSERIDGTLANSVEKILREGAREIGKDTGSAVAEGAKEILGASGDYHFLRGQIWIVFSTSVIATISYWLGLAGVFSAGGTSAMDILMGLPAGWLAFICGSTYTYMWSWDHWDQVKDSPYYKAGLAVMAAALVMIAVYLLG